MIDDPIDDAFLDIYNAVVSDFNQEDNFSSRDMENILSEYGLMIVPIEDPTNVLIGMVDE